MSTDNGAELPPPPKPEGSEAAGLLAKQLSEGILNRLINSEFSITTKSDDPEGPYKGLVRRSTYLKGEGGILLCSFSFWNKDSESYGKRALTLALRTREGKLKTLHILGLGMEMPDGTSVTPGDGAFIFNESDAEGNLQPSPLSPDVLEEMAVLLDSGKPERDNAEKFVKDLTKGGSELTNAYEADIRGREQLVGGKADRDAVAPDMKETLRELLLDDLPVVVKKTFISPEGAQPS